MDEEEKKKQMAKMALMRKLKDMDLKPKMQDTEQYQARNPLPKIQTGKGMLRVDTEEDFKKMPYEGKAKYDNQLKALNALKSQNPEASQKPKKMFFEHYDTSEPYCPNIPNNPNPSGRPPNIPPEMYEGIVVKPKRPWVYLGTENLPPVQYQEINDKSFKEIQKKHFEEKRDPGQKQEQNKPKRKSKKQEENSDDYESNFQMSDELDMSGESMLVSDYKSQSKLSRSKGKSKTGRESSGFPYDDDSQMASEGVQSKKKINKMFNDMDDDSDMGMDIEENEDDSSALQVSKAGSKKDAKRQKASSKMKMSEEEEDDDDE